MFTGAGLVYTARTWETGQRTLESQMQGQITDRYSKATEQLGSEMIEVRLGAIYALERIARDSQRDSRTIQNVLAAFSRNRVPCASNSSQRPAYCASPKPSNAAYPYASRLDADIEAALQIAVSLTAVTKIGLDLSKVQFQSSELKGINLSGASMVEAKLSSANLTKAHLVGADLRRAVLYDAFFDGANLSHANLSGAFCSTQQYTTSFTYASLRYADVTDAQFSHADLQGADLTGIYMTHPDDKPLIPPVIPNGFVEASMGDVRLVGAKLPGAYMWGADLLAADLSGATLRDAHLRSANLSLANLAGTDLRGTDLRGADLRGVKGITPAEIRKVAITDASTKFDS
uniref:pentapeptide repeat-containing protein n=1 Tax=Nonomuraea pusilla TaxID=46177 RepID=UPI00159C5244|nr:pentapeptide repeat-containing protein [Nonomuraea pusilla]